MPVVQESLLPESKISINYNVKKKTKPVYVSKIDALPIDKQLLDSAEIGDYRTCERLLNEGANVNYQDHNGYTPLSEAAVAGNAPVCGLLLRADADPNFCSNYEKRTPLHRACFHRWEPVVDLLCMYGANPWAKDIEGNVPGELGFREKMKAYCESDQCMWKHLAPPNETEETCGSTISGVKDELSAKSGDKSVTKEETTDVEMKDSSTVSETAENKRMPGEGEEFIKKEDKKSTTIDPRLLELQSKWEKAKAKIFKKQEERRLEREAKQREKDAARDKLIEEMKIKKEQEKEEKRLEQERYEAERKYRQEEVEREHKKYMEEMYADGNPEAIAEFKTMQMMEIRKNSHYLILSGAGEQPVNGKYRCVYFDTQRVEYRHINNDQCNLLWTTFTREWRIIIGNYKNGNTLYRNSKVLKTQEVPLNGWQKWFGKDGEPIVEIREGKVVLEEEGESEVKSEGVTKEEKLLQAEPNREESEKAPESVLSDKSDNRKPKIEFLECRHILQIREDITKSEVDAPATTIVASSNPVSERGVRKNRLIQEVKDGSSNTEIDDSVGGTINNVRSKEETEILQSQLNMLLKVDDPIIVLKDADVTGVLVEIEKTKNVGNTAFTNGEIEKALMNFSRALDGMDDLETFNESNNSSTLTYHQKTQKAEAAKLKSILHSNRSLTLLKIIEEKLYDDAGILDILYEQIKLDSTLAIQATTSFIGDDGTASFKAYYRRSIACFNLEEYDQALNDVNFVLNFYDKQGKSGNPDAIALKEKIVTEIKSERKKWVVGKTYATSNNRAMIGGLMSTGLMSTGEDENDCRLSRVVADSLSEFGGHINSNKVGSASGLGSVMNSIFENKKRVKGNVLKSCLEKKKKAEVEEAEGGNSTRGNTTWSRVDVEKRLIRGPEKGTENSSGNTGLPSFPNPEMFGKLFEKSESLSIDGFTGILKELDCCTRTGKLSNEIVKAYFTYAKKAAGNLAISMLSDQETKVLEKFEKL